MTNLNTNTTISIGGKETAKHIREALKKVFPGFTFSVTSEYSSVSVYWEDGPFTPDVQKILNRFESYTRVIAKHDRKIPTGYEWKGEVYVGADYLNTSRALSHARRNLIIEKMESEGKYFCHGIVSDRLNAERELIEAGVLIGVDPLLIPELMRDQKPVINELQEEEEKRKAKEAREKVEAAKVIAFPGSPKKVVEAAFLKTLTPEQQFKFITLQGIFGNFEGIEAVISGEFTVDQKFTQVAEQLFGCRG